MRERGSKSNNLILRSYNKSCGAWCGGMTDIFGISTPNLNKTRAMLSNI